MLGCVQIIQVNLTSENPQPIVPGMNVEFTYSVRWAPSAIPFPRRFERYLDYNFFEHQVCRSPKPSCVPSVWLDLIKLSTCLHPYFCHVLHVFEGVSCTSNVKECSQLPLACANGFYMAAQIHWFSIFNSFMMVIFLTGLVSMILMRTLRADYARYTSRDEDDLEALERDVGEESGCGARPQPTHYCVIRSRLLHAPIQPHTHPIRRFQGPLGESPRSFWGPRRPARCWAPLCMCKCPQQQAIWRRSTVVTLQQCRRVHLWKTTSYGVEGEHLWSWLGDWALSSALITSLVLVQVEACAWGRVPAASLPGAAGGARRHRCAAGAARALRDPHHHCRCVHLPPPAISSPACGATPCTMSA